MKLYFWIAPFVVVGCGGDPFEAIPYREALSVDAGGDVDSDSDTPDVIVGDAVVMLDARHDAGSDTLPDVMPVDASSEAMADSGRDSQSCTPVVGYMHGWGACLTAATMANDTPYIFNGATCGFGMTPGACQCAETYNCACLEAQFFCTPHGGNWAGCHQDDGGAPTPICN